MSERQKLRLVVLLGLVAVLAVLVTANVIGAQRRAPGPEDLQVTIDPTAPPPERPEVVRPFKGSAGGPFATVAVDISWANESPWQDELLRALVDLARTYPKQVQVAWTVIKGPVPRKIPGAMYDFNQGKVLGIVFEKPEELAMAPEGFESRLTDDFLKEIRRRAGITE